MAEKYQVKKIFGEKRNIEVEVPGSKSITNRALLAAGLAHGESLLKGALFSQDIWDMIRALKSVGIVCEPSEEKKEILVKGCGGKLPVRMGEIYVGNSGITARFITALLAFSGGKFLIRAGKQMMERPMKPLIQALRDMDINIICEEKEGFFPFTMETKGVKGGSLHIDTTTSSQFLSAILMAGVLLPEGLEIAGVGERKKQPYVEMTCSVMKEFGVTVERKENLYTVSAGQNYEGRQYAIEPDMSSACYFFAMAVLLRSIVTVRGVHSDSLQGDLRFLEILKRFGATVIEDMRGITVIGSEEAYDGIDVNMNDCSDQTMTLAVLALFARGLTIIRGVGHIRYQESDRLFAIYNEVIRLGAKVEMKEDGIILFPMEEGLNHPVEIETYSDHRMAMAFALVGLRREGVTILNPDCTAKTFENYFDILEEIIKG